MDVIMHPKNDIETTNSQFNFWLLKNRSFLASLFFFLFILLSLRVDFSAFSISFFTFSLGRIHMFILCNGIVAILVKGSVLEDAEAQVKEIKNVGITQKPVVVIEQAEELSGCDLVGETEQVHQHFVEDELQQQEDGVEELSVEELNKKCDEFIRRMRGVISNAK